MKIDLWWCAKDLQPTNPGHCLGHHEDGLGMAGKGRIEATLDRCGSRLIEVTQIAYHRGDGVHVDIKEREKV